MTFEQNSPKPEKSFAEKTSGFKKDFESWSRENQDTAKQIRDELLWTAGVAESELHDQGLGFNWDLMKISTTELSVFGTNCGSKDNHPFSEEVIRLLQSRGVEFIIALGDNEKPIIASAAIGISGAEAKNFEKMISAGEGSLRADRSSISGWSVFESE